MTDASLYLGRVMHHRIRPKRHHFIYRMSTLLIDIDRIADVDRRLRLFSAERFNLFSFYNEDHGPRDGGPLRPWVEAELKTSEISAEPARILLLAMPRFLGYVFNPLSIYYCYDDNEQLHTIIYEVKNTFKEQHSYVLAVSASADSTERFYQRCAKDFYVSPFIQAEADYRFSINNPGNNLDVRIVETVDAGALLVATLQGRRSPLTDGRLFIQALSHPFLTQKVIASIHYEALRLWLKGISLQPRQIGKP